MTKRYYALAMVLGITFILLIFYALRGEGETSDNDGAEPRSVAERLMAHYDTNKDGVIDLEEAQIDGQLSALFPLLDSDKDGALTLDELLLYPQDENGNYFID